MNQDKRKIKDSDYIPQPELMQDKKLPKKHLDMRLKTLNSKKQNISIITYTKMKPNELGDWC